MESENEWESILRNQQKFNSLYAAFRARQANPVDYDYKMSFWKKTILNKCVDAGQLSFSLHTLTEQFRLRGKTPLGLKNVLEQMWKDGIVMSKTEYAHGHGASWLQWGLHTFITRPVKWSLSFLTTAWKEDTESTEFVLAKVPQGMIDRVLEAHYQHVRHELVDDTVELDELYEQCKHVCSTQQDLLMVLKELEKEKKIVIKNKVDTRIGMVVKFCHMKSQTSKLKISDVDIGILKLRHTVRSIDEEISERCDQLTKCDELARACVRKGNKKQAMNVLRKKKRLESLIDKKEGTLENLNRLLHQLEEADTDAMILQSYQLGVATLKQANAHISADTVNDTMDDIQEALSEQEAVSELMSGPGGIAGGVGGVGSEEELSGELAELLGPPVVPVVGFGDMSPVQQRQDMAADERLLAELDALPGPPPEPPREPPRAALPADASSRGARLGAEL